MTVPHPSLLELVAASGPTSVDDEPRMLASANEHRMSGAVLAAYEQGRLPLSRPTGTTLGIAELAEHRQHLRFWTVIQEVQRRLAKVGVEVAVLKGVATEARWYERLGQRIATDVDLLLDPGARRRAADVVEILDPARSDYNAIDRAARRGQLQHVDLVIEGVAIDLHFDPFKLGIPTRQLRELWDETELLATPQGQIRVLSAEAELMLLLLHLNKDAFSYLGPFLDVPRILMHDQLDWSRFRSLVLGEGLQVPVLCSLQVVIDTLKLDVVVPTLSGAKARSWKRVWPSSARLRGHEGRRNAPSRQRLLALHSVGRSGDVARELRRQLAPSKDLLEVAGRLGSTGSRARYLSFGRFRRESAVDADADARTSPRERIVD